MTTKEERLAANEAIFREVNERVAEVSGKLALDTVSAICECAAAGCVERFEISRRDYAEIRSGVPALPFFRATRSRRRR